MDATIRPVKTNAEGTLRYVGGPYKTQEEAGDRITDRSQVVTGNRVDGWYVAVSIKEAKKIVEKLLD